MLIAAIILGLTYLGIIFTRLPRVNIDRPAAALTGAVLMVLLGVVTTQQALGMVDFHTLGLLFGMMLLIEALRRAGFFTTLAARSVALATNPKQLLWLVVVATAVSSAFLVNDVVVLLFTPIVVTACRQMRLNPVPYLIGEAMASNVGSVATIVGNPQNMLIGVASGISFSRFFILLLPVAVLSVLVLVGALRFFYRGAFSQAAPETPLLEHRALSVSSGHAMPAAQRRLLLWILPILGLTILGFFVGHIWGLGVPMVAVLAGIAAVLFSGVKPSRLIQGIDWVLLLFFAGLFVVIGAARQAGVLDFLLRRVTLENDAFGILSLHVSSTVISQIVSNVPLTMLVIPLIQQSPSELLYLSLAAGSTLGGNATLLGAVANIIVVEGAYKQGVEVKWWDFTRVGIVVTALTLAISILVLLVEFKLGFLS
ncbi:MAG: anion transporter [Chloroflexi bacterium]|nr:anion transporter [Chloroflexota bacterium]